MIDDHFFFARTAKIMADKESDDSDDPVDDLDYDSFDGEDSDDPDEEEGDSTDESHDGEVEGEVNDSPKSMSSPRDKIPPQNITFPTNKINTSVGNPGVLSLKKSVGRGSVIHSSFEFSNGKNENLKCEFGSQIRKTSVQTSSHRRDLKKTSSNIWNPSSSSRSKAPFLTQLSQREFKNSYSFSSNSSGESSSSSSPSSSLSPPSSLLHSPPSSPTGEQSLSSQTERNVEKIRLMEEKEIAAEFPVFHCPSSPKRKLPPVRSKGCFFLPFCFLFILFILVSLLSIFFLW